MKKPKYRQMHELILQGYSRRQAAEKLGLCVSQAQTLYTDALRAGRIKKHIKYSQPKLDRPEVIRQ